MTAAGVRIPHARWIVGAIALIGCSAILWLSRGYTFYFDEWTFILGAPGWTAASYLEPHNVHPAMLPRLIYAAMLGTVGLRAYWPYMFLLLALHGTSAILLFELVRRRAGDGIGIACTLILLVLGAGWESTWSTSIGAQYQLSQMMDVRAGYTYSQNPINSGTAGFNVGSPLILQHSLNWGTTLRLSKSLAMHASYTYLPQSEVSGPIQSPLGPVPGSNVNYRVSAHGIGLGMTASY